MVRFMKKSNNKFLFLIATALIYALINVILFLTLPDGRTDSKVFWLVWSFMTPVSLLATVALILWGTRKNADDLIGWTVSIYLIGIFTIAYFAVGFIFAYLPWKSITLPLILELIITIGAYVSMGTFTERTNHITVPTLFSDGITATLV
jgi:hypothetical protein